MPKKSLHQLQSELDKLDAYYEYVAREQKRYINDLKKLLMNVSEEITYVSSMIYYLDKEIKDIRPRWTQLRKEIFFYEEDKKD